MSARALNWAWAQHPNTTSQKLVLAALGDRADEDGNCYPGFSWIAEKCAPMPTETVRRVVRELAEQGLLVKLKRRRREDGTLSSWDLQLPVDQRAPVNGSPACTGDQHHRAPMHGQNRTTGTVKEVANATSSNVELSVSDVQTVYDYWRAKRQKTRANYDRISDGRRQKIRARLKEFSVAELEQAVDGVGRDPWPERPRHDDITVIFRSRETVERFLEMLQPANGRVFKRRFGIGMTTEEILSTIEEGT